MSAIDTVRVDPQEISVRKQESFKEATRRAMWAWYRDNKNTQIARKRVLFFTLRLRIEDLHFLFEMLFGPEKTEWDL